MTHSANIPHPSQEQRVLDALLAAKGEWLSKRYFIEVLHLTQSGRAIWNLENAPHWKDWHGKIQHSDFTDEWGFKSYRISPEHIPAQITQPKDPSHFRCQYCPKTAVAFFSDRPRCPQHQEVLKPVPSLF